MVGQKVTKQIYPISFTGGVDTKTDPKQVMAGNLLTLQNGLFNNTGQLNKRFGSDILSQLITGTSDFISSAQAINVFNDEILLFNGFNIYSYIVENQTWANKGIATSVVTNNKQIIRSNQADQENPDVGFFGNAEVYVWEDSRGSGGSGSVRYSVLDTTTQSIIINDQPVSTNAGDGYQKPKVIAFNGELFMFYTDGYQGLYYQYINPVSSPNTISDQVQIVSDGYVLTNSSFSYDVSVIGNNMYVVYTSEGSGTGAINTFYLSPTLTKTGLTTVAIGTEAIRSPLYESIVSIVGDSLNNVWITWIGLGDTNQNCIYVATYTYTGIQTLAPSIVSSQAFPFSTISIIENPLILGSTIILGEIAQNTATPWTNYLIGFYVAADGNVDDAGNIRSIGLASKLYNVNGNIYVNVSYSTPDNATYFTLLFNNGITGGLPSQTAQQELSYTVVGKVDSGTGGGLRTNNMLSEVVTVSNGIVKFANLTKGSIISEAGTVFTLTGVNSTLLDYENPNQFQAVTQNNNLMIVGGVIQIYDGISVVESNFHYPPENITATVSGSGSGLGTGQYEYQVTYEWMDNNGQIEASTPSNGTIVQVTAGQNVTLTIPTLRLTKKTSQQGRTSVTICVYRTPVDGTGDTLNEVTSIIAPLLNSTTADTVTFTDTLSDIDAASNRFIYTDGGVLENVAPPSANLITLYQNRVVLGGLEDPNLLWFSQNKQDYSNYNTTPTNFAAELTIGCDPLGGPITAIKNLNQNLIIFKKTNIFVVNGDGPNNTGGGTSYPNPQFLTSDVGCSNQNSIAIIPPSSSGQGEAGGIIFQSDKGIFLLDQGLNVTYIGAPVYAYNSETITSTTLVPDQNQVIFTTLSGTSLVYDYYVNQWSTFTNQAAIDSVIFQNEFTYVNTLGQVYQTDENIFTDAGAPIFMSWTSPNFSFAQLNGYQRVFNVMILGTYKGPHTLNVSVAYDDSPIYTQFATINVIGSTAIWGEDAFWGQSSPWGGTYTPYQFRIDFKQQVCTSIRIMITDNQTSNYNEGYSISAMTFTVGVLGGANRIPATQVVGTQ
jgi:hypothetical protein